MRARRALEQLIREAAEQEAFEIHYRPLLRVLTVVPAPASKPSCVSPTEREDVPPSTFIPAIGIHGANQCGRQMGD